MQQSEWQEEVESSFKRVIEENPAPGRKLGFKEKSDMFSTAKNELRELILLVREVAVDDATLAASPTIQPSDASLAARRNKEQRMVELQVKYELV